MPFVKPISGCVRVNLLFLFSSFPSIVQCLLWIIAIRPFFPKKIKIFSNNVILIKEQVTWERATTELSSFTASSTIKRFGLDFWFKMAVASLSLGRGIKLRNIKENYQLSLTVDVVSSLASLTWKCLLVSTWTNWASLFITLMPRGPQKLLECSKWYIWPLVLTWS